ncbi:plasmid pRiA4b ORF-3 family protein [Arthrobacter sp. UYCu723]
MCRSTAVLQAAFSWEDAHLHRFSTDDPFAPLRPVDGEVPEVLQWLPEQECEEPGDKPEEDCSLDQLLTLGSGAAFYEYEFGDSWLHRLELVSRRPAGPDSPHARLIDGTRRGPLEDSGGCPGYEEIMDALADPAHPNHAEHFTVGTGASRVTQRKAPGSAALSPSQVRCRRSTPRPRG